MKKMLSLVLAGLLCGAVVKGDETVFSKVKVADPTGKQTDARLIFNDADKKVMVRVAEHDLVNIPYDHVDKFSYEYTKKHRITQGAIVMVASLGAGAIVMLTKSRSHWLYIDFRDDNAPKSVVLRMDKKEYKNILDAIKAHTGKEVVLLQDEKGKKKDTKPAEKPADKPADKPTDKPSDSANPATP